ncbi:MAG: hypothetical protein ACOZF2_04905 [Thermodesulfobacteriota bacterium]
MTEARMAEDGRYWARCAKCGTWVEVYPVTAKGDLFFEVLKAGFHCCGRQQSAIFTREKDCLDFH